MADFHAASLSSSLISANSANSFNFVEVLDPDECQLLSSSISLDSLWSTNSDESVPPYPNRPVIRIVPMLLDSRCMLYPFGRGKNGPDEFKVLTSIPTPPRMRNLLLEPLCIDKWVETISIRTQPPGHNAWERAAPVKEGPWVPSGSLFSPSDFKRALSAARGAYRKAFGPFTTFNSVIPRIKECRPSDPKSFRKALVFEREITLNTEGQTKRWSLQVPAATMNPEMVDIMLELQDLNSFFKDSLVGLEESVAVLEKEKDKLHSEPPTLIVSDSHCSFPLSGEPLARTQYSDPSLPLATRRGRNPLPPLTVTKKVEKDPYPSIPTAFLGSPSAYSPKFEFANAGDEPLLDLEHMVTNLRSQCVFLRTVHETRLPSVESPLSDTSFGAASDPSDDDWAFAVSFVDEYDNQVVDTATPPNRLHEASKSPYLREDHVAGLDVLSKESLTPRAHSPSYPPSPVPLMPLPALPSPVLRDPLFTPSPRGILKSCKNVRFASLPDKSGSEARIETGIAPSTPTPSGSSGLMSPKAPLRNKIYSRPSKAVANLPDLGINSQLIPHIPSKRVEYTGGNCPTPSAVPVTPVESSQIKKPTFAVHRSPPRPCSVVALARKSTPNLLGRQPFGRLDSGDENKPGTPTSPQSKAESRWTMNDMSFRRGSTLNQNPEGTPKSRMPVPLRNILTRFK